MDSRDLPKDRRAGGSTGFIERPRELLNPVRRATAIDHLRDRVDHEM
jgi:hypothetical protein